MISEVQDGKPVPVPGVPFHTPELYVKEGVYGKLAKGGDCDRTSFVETEVLPLGPLYYANVDPAQLAKTGFTIKFNDKGAVGEVTLNTEPEAGEALKNAAEFVKSVAPLLGVAAAAAPMGNPACDAGPEGVKYTLFSEWQATHK